MTRDRNAVLDRVRQAIPSEGSAFERLQDRRDRKLIRRRIGGASVGLGLTLAIVAALMIAPLDAGDTPDRIVPGDTSVPLVVGPGEYYYSRGWSWYPDGDGMMTGQMWVGLDDSGRMLRGPGPVDSKSYGRKDQRFEAGDFPADLVPQLSTDPDELLVQLTERGSSGQPLASSSPGRTVESTMLLRAVQDLLTNSLDDRFVVLTPEQRAALFQVASGLEEIAVEDDVADPYGRPAVRLSWVVDYGVGPGSRVLWYFEPSTGQFMGELWVNQGSGEVVAASMVEHAGITPSLDEHPDPNMSYVPKATGEPDLGPIELPPIGG